MRTFYAFPAVFEPGDDPGNVVVTFPDVPEAITQGAGEADARAMAADALGVALLGILHAKRPLPRPSKPAKGQPMVHVAPDLAAKLAVLEAFRDAGITQGELAGRLDIGLKEVRRILDPDHPSKLPTLVAALTALGRRLVVGVEAA